MPVKIKEKCLAGDEIVISGISGQFPNSNSVSEFMENLYNKVDMVSKIDVDFDHPEVPQHAGKITGIDKFDAQFFSVPYNQAISLDPTSRKLTEHCYTAIYDSGTNPLQYQGRKIGVFMGSTYADYSKEALFNFAKRNNFIVSGTSKTMSANRFSYWVDSKAPSYQLDGNCSSAMICLENAYNAIKTGVCEAALVGGAQLCHDSILSLNIKRKGLLCLDGKTKCFNNNGDGYVRSEAINVVFIQKAKDALRIYAEIHDVKSMYGLKPDAEFLPLRKTEDIEEFLEDFYSEAGILPKDIEYVEAHGVAIAKADANELEAIGNVFGKENAVKVGCVKSNMGNSEAAAGLSAIAKMCLAYHKGEIPANLHYDEPLNIPAFQEGKVEVVTENTDFRRGFTAVNNFSITGTNCHVLLKGKYKPKDVDRYKTDIPRLILISGRHEKAVENILNNLKNRPIDPELIGMLHNIYQTETSLHTFRGYTILETNNKNETVSSSQSVELHHGGQRPLWLVYSGMGSQWAGMGTELLRIPTFAAAIERCRRVLEPKGVDIIKIITEPDKSMFDFILNCFVGIAAIQIGLTDILKEMGIVPDNIIGHSVGELGCAYADGCFSAEEMILVAYHRGLVFVENEFIRGSMAAVGIGYNDILPICPPEIEVACHNSKESCTISGPADIVDQFVNKLTAKSIFAKTVPTANIAYHSRYIKEAGPIFIKELKKIIKTPMPRSEKWICTSLPKEQWNDPLAKYSSPEYHTNNLLNPVLFEESAKMIPPNAVLVEVAPHGLLQAILKRSHKDCTHIPLTSRGHSDPVRFFLKAVGKLYQEGYNPKVDIVYPKIEFPVSTETPLLSHFVEWDHSEKRPVNLGSIRKKICSSFRTLNISVLNDDYKFLKGFNREQRNVLSEAAVLVMVWETLAMYKGVSFEIMSIAFANINFNTDVVIEVDVTTKLDMKINKGSYYFEVSHENVVFVTGYIIEVKMPFFEDLGKDTNLEEKDNTLSSKDIYQLMNLKGYNYSNDFRSISSLSLQNYTAQIKTTNNWTIILDSLIQLNMLANNYDGISIPKLIGKLTIDASIMAKNVEHFQAKLDKHTGVSGCCGVEIRNIVFKDKVTNIKEPDVIEALKFIPYNTDEELPMETAIHISLQVVADNILNDTIVTNIIANKGNTDNNVPDMINNSNIFDVDVEVFRAEEIMNMRDADVLYIENLFSDQIIYNKTMAIVKKDTFIISLENKNINFKSKNEFINILHVPVKDKLLLLSKKTPERAENVIFIPINQDDTFSWVSPVQCELQKPRRVCLVSVQQPDFGLYGFVKKINKESKKKIGLIVVDDIETSSFDPEEESFKKQLEKDVAINILRKGQWGAYHRIPIPKSGLIAKNHELVNVRGDINSFRWTETLSDTIYNNSIQVCFAGPTKRDAQNASGITEAAAQGFGMDFSGIDIKNNRVMGLIPSGSLASQIRADPEMLWPVPSHWSLEEAATVPWPYVHAFYCLNKIQLRPCMSVLVTDGAEALGQALISICLALQCTVYTTVDSTHKKTYLMALFPQLSENNIGYSQDSSFSDMVIINSNNKRCNFVINSFSGSLRALAMKCVGFGGMFVNVNDTDSKQNQDFNMSFLWEEKNCTYLDFSNIFRSENFEERKLVQQAISEGITRGYVRPISYVTYDINDVSKAFDLLLLNKYTGRVLINMRDLKTPKKNLSAVPSISSNGTYVVVCDNHGLGIELANRLVRRGAKQLLLHLPKKNIDGYTLARIEKCKELGANIKVSTKELKSENDCIEFLFNGNSYNNFVPIHSIFIIQEPYQTINANYSQEDFLANKNEKISIITNLDVVSRNNCTQLKQFVVITHVQNIVDEYTDAVYNKLCQGRSEAGLPALAFRIEAIQQDTTSEDHSKIQPQAIDTILNALETSLKQNHTNVRTYDINKSKESEYLRRVAQILGVKDITSIKDNLHLADVVPNDISIIKLKTLLHKTRKYDYSVENLKEMSIHTLKTLGSPKTSTKFNSGLETLFNFVDHDEYAASEDYISMYTLLNREIIVETEKNIDAKETYLMLIPGFEGHQHIFESLCETLKIRAVTFQLTPDLNCDSIPKIAANITKYMKKRLQVKSKFYLLGYSFGVNVALEIAALLEKAGLVGVVYCLDSSPDALKVQLDAYIGKLTEEQLQNAIIDHLFYVISGQKSDALKHEIEESKSWSEKVDICVNKLKKYVSYTHQYKKSVIEAAYKRIMLARSYKPNLKLESELILLKGLPHPNSENLPLDYNLSEYSKQPVKVYNIESDVATAYQDCRVSNIINQTLDQELLEKYKATNLCETYLSDRMRGE